MMHRKLGLLTAALLGIPMVACGGSPCAGDLAGRLAAARSGDVVSIEGCGELTGHFVVPAGVTLAGPGTLRGDGGTVVTLETAPSETTTVHDVTVLSATPGASTVTGIETRGEGEALLGAITVEASVGVGVALGAMRNVLAEVRVHGAVTTANVNDVRWLTPRASVEATHGILVSRGWMSFAGGEVTGFAEVGISLGAAQGDMTLGPVDASIADVVVGHGLGVGIASSATMLHTRGVRVEELWTGVRGWPSYGVLVVDGHVTTQALSVTDADGFGIVQIAGEAQHDALTLSHTGDAGLWVGTEVQLDLTGGSRLSDTAFAAITAVDASRVSLADTTIDGVRVVRRTVGVRGAIDVGDGIDAVGTPLTLARVTIGGAGRAGLVLDRAAGLVAGDLVDVSVTAEGTALGAILGDVDRTGEALTPTSVAGWDTGVTRLGAAATNDAAFTASLAISVAATPPSTSAALGVIAPMY